MDAFHRCCTLLIVAKLGDMTPTSRWGTATPVVLWVPKWNLPQSLQLYCVRVQLVVRMACSLGPGNTYLEDWFILTVPRPGHNSETARTPQPSKNNDSRRRVAPFNTTIPPTNAILTTHTHGVRLQEIVVSFSSLDTKLLPRWKIILTIHAIRTDVTGYGLTVHGRGGAASDAHPRI